MTYRLCKVKTSLPREAGLGHDPAELYAIFHGYGVGVDDDYICSETKAIVEFIEATKAGKTQIFSLQDIHFCNYVEYNTVNDVIVAMQHYEECLPSHLSPTKIHVDGE